MRRWPLLKEVEGTACSPSTEPGITEATHSTTAIWLQAGSDWALPFRINIMFISHRKTRLAYRKISPRNACPWDRKQYLQPLDYRNRTWNSVSRKPTPFSVFHHRDQHPQFSEYKRDFLTDSLLLLLALLHQVKHKSDWAENGSRASSASSWIIWESPMFEHKKKVFKMFIKMHLPANKDFHHVPS